MRCRGYCGGFLTASLLMSLKFNLLPALSLKSRSNGAPFGAQMVCKALLGVSRMEEDLHSGSFCEVEGAGLPSGHVQPLGLQSVLRGRWRP